MAIILKTADQATGRMQTSGIHRELDRLKICIENEFDEEKQSDAALNISVARGCPSVLVRLEFPIQHGEIGAGLNCNFQAELLFSGATFMLDRSGRKKTRRTSRRVFYKQRE